MTHSHVSKTDDLDEYFKIHWQDRIANREALEMTEMELYLIKTLAMMSQAHDGSSSDTL